MMSNNRSRSWYLIYTKPHSELNANANLMRQGYKTYLPVVRCKQKRNHKYIDTTKAFFSRYLFIRLDKELDNWAPIRSTHGVTGVVKFGGIPAVVPDDLIKQLKANESEDDSGLQLVVKKIFNAGDRVDIVDGLFEGYTAICQSMKSNERVTVLLDIVGKCTQVNLSLCMLEMT